MKRYKLIWKLPFIAILAIVTILSFNSITNAADTTSNVAVKLPYAYEFSPNSTKTFNGFTGVKDMVIAFDNAVLGTPDTSNVKLYHLVKDDKTVKEVPVNGVIDTVTKDSNKVTISFKNLEYLDFSASQSLEYVIKIEQAANVVAAQTSAIDLPFNIYEVLPGFKSMFIDNTDAELINKNIFKKNAPRDVKVHIPTAYITEIKTIHRYDGVSADSSLREPALTNIDVLTHANTARMKTWIGASYNDTDQYSRDLDYREDIKGFSMGQAGINELVCLKDTCPISSNDLNLVAYDKYGKKVAGRSFKVKVNDMNKGFTTNDYVKKPDKIFGTTVSLYDLMVDTKKMTAILNYYTLADLDKLGVTYEIADSVTLPAGATQEQLQLALDNSAFKTIHLPDDITINGDIVINRDVTINGNGHTIRGNVVLGDGSQDLLIRLDDVNVDGNLAIDVGANGTAILNGGSVNHTNILSGGTNSIYLLGFHSANGIEFNNTTPVRVVKGQDSTNTTITLNTPNPVTIEGLSGDLAVNVKKGIAGKLTVKNSTGSVHQGSEAEQGTLTLNVSDTVNYPSATTGWTIVVEATQMEDGKAVIEITHPENVASSAWDWQALGIDLINLPTNVTFIVSPNSKNVFGPETEVILTSKKLKITGTPTVLNELKDIILIGTTADKIYKYKVSATVTNQ